MKNPYHIIDKQLNQSWDQWLSKRKEGEEVTVPFNYRYDNVAKKMRRLTKEGFFKKNHVRGGYSSFIRTEANY